jgi:hypothetical protein
MIHARSALEMHWIPLVARQKPARRTLAAALAACCVTAGCGDDAERPAAACTEGPESVLAALRKAPGKVTVGGRPLSRCLTDGSNADDVQRVGSAWVTAAAALSDRARRRHDRVAALRLGYLVGSARRGAAGTPGIHAELVRRLEQEAAPLEGRSEALGRGERAGRRLG